MTGAFYSEHDPGAAEWLRELMAAGLIAPGVVDERSIADLTPNDLRGFTQVHLFAGIGGWSLALRLAGWADTRPVWTGSCPCQPYSPAGKGLGDADPRNLWPHMFRLTRECRPVVVFGEQVEGAVRKGWLDGVSADLEGEGYAVGSVVLGAHSIGAPHLRQRIFWVADAGRFRSGTGTGHGRGVEAGERGEPRDEPEHDGRTGWLADAGRGRVRDGHGLDVGGTTRGARGEVREQRVRADVGAGGHVDGVADPDSDRAEGEQREEGSARGARGAEPVGSCTVRGVANTDGGFAGHRGVQPGGEHGQQPEDGLAGVAQGDASGHGPQGGSDSGAATRPVDGADRGFWADSTLLACRDGKARRVPTEPALFPLAPGLPGRVGLLRGSGNAICPQTAAIFIQAYREVTEVA